MLRKTFLLILLALLCKFNFAQSLISINPDQANIPQTLTTTVTASDFWFQQASAPTIFDTYLIKNGYQIFPNWISVIDDDHFDANWTFSPGMPPGVYDLVHDYGFGWPPLSATLPGAFTLYDTCLIYMSPATGTVCQGDSVLLSYSTASSYQWKLNGANIAGATASTYYAKLAGAYTVVTTGSNCPGTSQPANVTLNALPVATISPPVTTNLCPGQTVTLQANIQAGLTYQWKRNGNLISGAVLSSLLVRDQGNYKVVVTGLNGCTNTSAAVTINLISLPSFTITRQPSASGGKDAYVQSYTPNANAGNDPEVNALSWTISGAPFHSRGLFAFDLSGIPPGSTLISAELNLYFNPSSNNALHTQYGDNKAYLMRITSPWTESTVTWNNQPPASTLNQVLLPVSTSTTQDYTQIDVTNLVKNMVDTPSAGYGFLLKLVTEVKYRSLLFCSSEHPTASKHPKLVVKYVKAVVTASNGVSICNGDSTTLSTGTGPYTYQWKKNGSAISGATTAAYAAKTAGTYTVKVTNALGCTVVSQPKAVTVNSLPSATITADGPVTFCSGDSVQLKANYNVNLQYQWKKNSINIPGATNRKYQAKTQGTYKVRVTNANGCSKTSSGVTVTVPCREAMPEDASFNVTVYPNPSAGDFNFRMENAGDENIIIRIYDLTGRKIREVVSTDLKQDISVQLKQTGIFRAEIIQGRHYQVLTIVCTE